MFAAIAILAMSVRALVPAGFMLAPSQNGGASIVLCSGHGPIEIANPHRAGGAGKNKANHSGAPCNFAAVAHLAAPQAAPILLRSLDSERAAPHVALIAQPGRGLAAPPPWSTGPPISI